ncbi:MAG: hypothetical protein Q8R18_01240 [bacterium]|nr:hypothetical protein [bacterium]
MTKHEIEGWYSINGSETTIKEIRNYEANTAQEAIDKAKADGCQNFIYLGIPLGEFQFCRLGAPKITLEHKERTTPLLEDLLRKDNLQIEQF